jgi:hypothetical protein
MIVDEIYGAPQTQTSKRLSVRNVNVLGEFQRISPQNVKRRSIWAPRGPVVSEGRGQGRSRTRSEKRDVGAWISVSSVVVHDVR